VNAVLLGEYEQTLAELVKVLDGRGSPEKILGLAWRTGAGEVILNQRRELLPNLDELPWPHRETLPLGNYRVAGYPPPVLYMYWPAE
jgi:hypothetical protein